MRASSSSPPTETARFERCDVRGNYIGFNLSSEAGVRIFNSNIVDNRRDGANSVALLEGCYVSDNRGEVGTDLTEGGEIDGVFDIETNQLSHIDAIRSPRSMPIEGLRD